jgi:hypothetical protein
MSEATERVSRRVDLFFLRKAAILYPFEISRTLPFCTRSRSTSSFLCYGFILCSNGRGSWRDLDGRGVSEFRKLVHEFMWNFQQVHIAQGDVIGKAVIASWVTQSINLHLRYGMASNRATMIGEGGQNHPIQVLQLHIWIYPSCHIGQLAGMFLHFDCRASWCPTYQRFSLFLILVHSVGICTCECLFLKSAVCFYICCSTLPSITTRLERWL